MKIAFLLNSVKGYGVQKTAITLANGINRVSNDTIMIFVSNSEQEASEEIADSIAVKFSGKKGFLRSLPFVMKQINHKKIDIVYAPIFHYGLVLSFLSLLGFFRNQKIIVSSANDIRSSLNSRKSRCVFYLASLFNRFADHAVALNKKMANDFISYLHIPNNKITTIYNPVYRDEIETLSQEPLDYPFFHDPSTKVVLAVGRLTTQKGFPLLLKAFARVEDKNIRLLILGEGAMRNELNALSKELGIEDRVDMPGFVDNPFPYFAQADLFVLSSIWEGFGNVLVEALACGASIVSTNCQSGPEEILDHGTFGKIVPLGDHKKMASAISFSLEHPSDPNVQKTRAREYHVDSIAQAYSNCFKNLYGSASIHR